MTTHHAFSIEHARLYGMREAVLIRNLHFWVSHNHANGTHQHDGRTWTYNSVRAFEDLFPYLTYKQIRTSLDTLISLDVLVRGYYSTNLTDRSSWFAFTDEFLAKHPLPARAGPQKKASAPTVSKGKTPSAPQGTPLAPQGTSSALEGTSLISTDITTDVNADGSLPATPSGSPAAHAAPPLAVPVPEKQEVSKPLSAYQLKLAQAGLRQETWAAFDEAYLAEYKGKIIRNATTNSLMASLVNRLGDAAPDVAAFYLRVTDPYVKRNNHSLNMLLQNAESYHLQWQTNRPAAAPVSTYQARNDQRAATLAGLTDTGENNDLNDRSRYADFNDDNTVDADARFID